MNQKKLLLIHNMNRITQQLHHIIKLHKVYTINSNIE